MIGRVFLFLVINFAGLAIGGFFTGSGVSSQWYADLNQAPWTPPGWVFGFAWTTIMLCFAVYMAFAFSYTDNKKILVRLFVLQWILNILWNPVFFYFREVALGFIVILLLTFVIGVLLFKYNSLLKFKSILILPYFVWLLVASSLNGYIFFMN